MQKEIIAIKELEKHTLFDKFIGKNFATNYLTDTSLRIQGLIPCIFYIKVINYKSKHI